MREYRKSKCRLFFHPFIPYPSSICSLIVVEPIFLQSFPIGAHKEIKPLRYQLAFYATLQQVRPVHRLAMFAKKEVQLFRADRLSKTLVNKFNMLPQDGQRASRLQIIIFAATPKGSLLSQSCLGKIFAAMIGINPSPSSQFVPSPLHKPQRRREESQETKREQGLVLGSRCLTLLLTRS